MKADIITLPIAIDITHNIKKLVEIRNVSEANKLLTEGWVLLEISQHNGEFVCVLGHK